METQYETSDERPRSQKMSNVTIDLGVKDFSVVNTTIGKLLGLKTTQESIFVLFYSMSCGVCTRVVPLYKQLAEKVPHRLALCNLSEHAMVASMSANTVKPLKVVPMLFCYRGGVPYTLYSDSWNAEKMVDYMNHSNPNSNLKVEQQTTVSDGPIPYNEILCSTKHGCYLTN